MSSLDRYDLFASTIPYILAMGIWGRIALRLRKCGMSLGSLDYRASRHARRFPFVCIAALLIQLAWWCCESRGVQRPELLTVLVILCLFINLYAFYFGIFYGVWIVAGVSSSGTYQQMNESLRHYRMHYNGKVNFSRILFGVVALVMALYLIVFVAFPLAVRSSRQDAHGRRGQLRSP